MDAYMAADAKGDQEIRPVPLVTMMNYQRRTFATTSAAKTVPHQHPFAQATKKAQRMMSPIIA